MAIYTRTGDSGQTSIRGGDRVSKGSPLMEVLGSVDELNSHLGLAVAMIKTIEFQVDEQRREALLEIRNRIYSSQGYLLEAGASLAQKKTSNGQNYLEVEGEEYSALRKVVNQVEYQVASTAMDREDIDGEIWGQRVMDMEQDIDTWDTKLPELRNFILPGGGVVGAELMIARTICRRAERQLVRLTELSMEQDPGEENLGKLETIRYLNRLSDWLFVLSRWVNKLVGEEEKIWKG